MMLHNECTPQWNSFFKDMMRWITSHLPISSIPERLSFLPSHSINLISSSTNTAKRDLCMFFLDHGLRALAWSMRTTVLRNKFNTLLLNLSHLARSSDHFSGKVSSYLISLIGIESASKRLTKIILLLHSWMIKLIIIRGMMPLREAGVSLWIHY